MRTVVRPAEKAVAVVSCAMLSLSPCASATPPRMSGTSNMTYAIATNVVMPPRISRDMVVLRSLRRKNFSSADPRVSAVVIGD